MIRRMKIGRPAIVCTVLAVFLFISVAALAYDDGTPGGYSGAPAVSGRTCTSCHSGSVNTGPGTVVVQAPTVYTPGSVIPVTVSLTNMQRVDRNGYQSAVFDTGNQILGGWVLPDGDSRVISNHANQSKTGYRKNTWLTYYQTPTTAKTFTIYTSGMDANGDGGKNSDYTYTRSHRVTPGTVNLSLMGLPKTGTSIPLALNAPGEGNKPYIMASSFGNSGINIGGRTIPLSPDTLMLLTVQNLIPALFQNYQGFLSASGTAGSAIAVPGYPALAGLTFHNAFIVIDFSKPNGIGTISNGLAVTLY